ncbi:MAG: hypothetical protein D6B26_00670 [Spirochaetaceae bacterium]|nr:MAG: hypothetical protein D6B26_00670 [Spirochaetaceae bacterium]
MHLLKSRRVIVNRVEKIDDLVAVRSALISVSNKEGLDGLLVGLAGACPGIKIYSTGGTFSVIESLIKEKGLGDRLTLISISDYTGQPEMQGGLVKTLDYRIYLGLLSETYNDDHRKDIQRNDAIDFDLTVVNLYPFQQTVAAPGCKLEDARANIDIGGPTMIRASAKNYLRVTTMCDPLQYPMLISELDRNHGKTGLKFRFEAAKTAFSHTANYDSAISSYLDKTALDSHQYQLENKE